MHHNRLVRRAPLQACAEQSQGGVVALRRGDGLAGGSDGIRYIRRVQLKCGITDSDGDGSGGGVVEEIGGVGVSTPVDPGVGVALTIRMDANFIECRSQRYGIAQRLRAK